MAQVVESEAVSHVWRRCHQLPKAVRDFVDRQSQDVFAIRRALSFGEQRGRAGVELHDSALTGFRRPFGAAPVGAPGNDDASGVQVDVGPLQCGQLSRRALVT